MLVDQRISITTPSGQMDTWIFQPGETGVWPAVILHADIKGVRGVFVDMARRLASHGFVVLLPNLYYRLSPAPVVAPETSPRDDSGKELFRQLRQAISVEAVRSDHRILLDYLSGLVVVKNTGFGIVGYCLSGAIALRTAADFPGRIVAAASFHGGRLASDADDSPHLRAADIRAKVYLGYARDDASMTDEMIAQLESSLAAAGVDYRSELYPARHGFAVADSASFDAGAAERHWQRLLGFLDDALRETP